MVRRKSRHGAVAVAQNSGAVGRYQSNGAAQQILDVDLGGAVCAGHKIGGRRLECDFCAVWRESSELGGVAVGRHAVRVRGNQRDCACCEVLDVNLGVEGGDVRHKV